MADASVLTDFKSADVDLNNNDDVQSALMELYQTVLSTIIPIHYRRICED